MWRRCLPIYPVSGGLGKFTKMARTSRGVGDEPRTKEARIPYIFQMESREKCVVVGIRSMYPSRAYMGFYGDEDQSLRRRAVDAEGNEIDLWWEFRDGAWELAEE